MENTISSFDKAVELGTDGLEMDCWLSRDNKVIVHHNSKINDGTTKSNKISKLTLSEIKDFILSNREKIPTLNEIFKKYKKVNSKTGNPILFSIDLQDNKVGDVIANMIIDFNLKDRVFLCGNNYIKLKRIRKKHKNIQLIASNMEYDIENHHNQHSMKFRRLNLEAFNIQGKRYKKNYSKKLTELGLKLFIWDLHISDDLEKFMELKPFAIYSDYPDLAVKIRKKI